MQGDGEVVAAGIELEATAEHDVAQHGEAAFAGDVQIGGQDAVGDDGESLVGVTATLYPLGRAVDIVDALDGKGNVPLRLKDRKGTHSGRRNAFHADGLKYHRLLPFFRKFG